MCDRIGIDLGGTKTEGVLLMESGREIARRRVPTPQADGYEAIVETVGTLVEELEKLGDTTGAPATVGVGIPGSPSPVDRRVRNSNTQCLNGRHFQQDLERRLGRSILVANDANCFTVAEARSGAGRGHGRVFGVILGTGVGGGIVHHGQLVGGRQGIAGEWGHHILDRRGPECFCGRRGCAEKLLCGPALERRFEALTGRTLALAEIAALGFETEAERRWRSDFLADFGVGLSNVINILDPDVVVLGGGVSNIDFLYTEGAEAVRSNIFGDVRETLILRNELGDSAGVLGAAMLWEGYAEERGGREAGPARA